jgi:rhodanese-related sulfurtransferase
MGEPREGSHYPLMKLGGAFSPTNMERQILTKEKGTPLREINPSQVYRAKVIIDLREADAFSTGHIAGAINLHQDLLEQRITEVVEDTSTRLLVYCAIGKEAPLRAVQLVDLGYQDVSFLKGGLNSWLEAGGTLELQQAKSSQPRPWWLSLIDEHLGSRHALKKARNSS